MNNLLQGLVGHWTMDEADAAARVDDVNGNNAVVVGANPTQEDPIVLTGFSAEVTGGSTGRLEIPNTSDLIFSGAESFSIAAWFIPITLTNDGGILSLFDGTTERSYALLFGASPDTMQFVVSPDGSNTNQTVVSSGALPGAGGAWHVAAVHDADNDELRLYLKSKDGLTELGYPNVAAHSTGVWGDSPNVHKIFRGAGITSFQSRIDELAVWRRALTTQDVIDHYNGGLGLAKSSWQIVSIRPQGNPLLMAARRRGRGD